MSAKYAQLTAARNASSGDAQHSPPPRGSVVSLKAAAAERAVLEHLVAEHVDIETRRSDGGRAALDVENAAKNHRIWRSHAHERSAEGRHGKITRFFAGWFLPSVRFVSDSRDTTFPIPKRTFPRSSDRSEL